MASTGGMLDSFFIEIADSWRSYGHTVSFAAGTPMVSAQATVIPGLSRRPDPRMVRALSGLRRWSDHEDLDVIITNSATASALVRMAGTKAPVVYFCHGLHWNEARSIGDRVWPVIERLLLPRTAGVISLNSDDQHWFARRLDSSRHLHLSAGVGLDLARYPARRLPNGPLRLCWIGEFSTRKRPHLVLDTAAELHRRGIDFHLEMLGEGAFRTQIRSGISNRGLSGIVSADGPGDAAAALARSHALVHTAQWEGLPRVMLENLAIGRGSYAFDVKGVRDIPLAQLTVDGDAAELAVRIAADWESGRLREPLIFDRDVLDYSHAADSIRQFLPTLIDTVSTTPQCRGIRMSNDVLISVIVPVYNGERYLRDCLRSILAQCHENLELIVVDDGSTDGTPSILDDFSSRDPRIMRLLADHAGASAARNAALAEARGEWIMFVDADDEMLSPCLLEAVAGVGDSGVDVVTFETSSDPADLADARDSALLPRHRCVADQTPRDQPQQVLDPRRLGPRIVDESFNTVWNKAYRREVVLHSGAQFPVGIHLGEDLLFNLSFARAASTGRHLSLLGYYYRRDNSASVTQRFLFDKHDELMFVNDALQQFASELSSTALEAAAGYIRAKNSVSSTRDLHHRQCPFPLREKLAAAEQYRNSAVRVSSDGLGPIPHIFAVAYNLIGYRSLFLLTGLLAAAGRRKRAG